ncbi:MAG TPA: sulfite exporter TauE/SafE family protein [Acidimicrobiales bacterium]|nr:sulfite exporter TauE/SafE family protein [Acidimicrobiales bacterium]
MSHLLVFAIAGLVGQLVDGSLGMGFGVTTSTVLLSNGFSPAVASASVHLAKIGTTLTSGVSHWQFGNVSWRLVARIGVPGSIGAFLGATVMSSLTGDWLAPAVAVVLFGLGSLVIVRSVRGDLRGERHDPGHLRSRLLAPLGLGAGFLDAVGGGGWGPVATPTLLAAGRVQPRYVIGSVSAAELAVTVAASAGFLFGLGTHGIDGPLVLAMLAGGVVAAPLAAWLVRHADASVLGVVVGVLLLITNVQTMLSEVGVPGAARLLVTLVIAAAGVTLALRVRRHGRRERERPAPPADVAEEAGAGVALGRAPAVR